MKKKSDIDVDAFWTRLESLVRERETTLSAVQTKMKLGGSYLFVIKNRNSIPSLDVVNRLADALDTTIDYLVKGTGLPIKSENVLEETILKKYRSDYEFHKAVNIILENKTLVDVIIATTR